MTADRRYGRVACLVVAGAVLTASCSHDSGARRSPSATPAVPVAKTARLAPSGYHGPSALVVPAALVDSALNLRGAPVAVPLRLEIPTLAVARPVLAVGITATNIMDAPEGAAQDPAWQAAFWYRGGGIPGAIGTATIAGHVDDSLGRPALFAHLDELRIGDAVIVRDLRTGLPMNFVVTATATYSLDEASTPEVLARLYGTGPVDGKGPQPSADGQSHLTLITCTGGFNYRLGTHDHRLVVFATRAA